MEAIPRRPWKSKNPFASRPMKISIERATQGVRARYDAVLPPFIPVVRSPGRPVILVPDSYWSDDMISSGVSSDVLRVASLKLRCLESGFPRCQLMEPFGEKG